MIIYNASLASSETPSPERDSERHIMIVAGEASGDLHAAGMVEAMRRLSPGHRYTGMGSHAMRRAGVEVLLDSDRLSVVGLWEVIAHYGELRRALARLKAHLREQRPDLLVLVDYVEFNLRLAHEAKRLGIRVLFYVSPQIWAWRPKRVRRIGRVIDAMAVLFPFEERIYRRYGIPVRYVGNPLVDSVRASRSREETRRAFGLDPDRPVVGLLPGSRRGELRHHLPLIMDTGRWLRQRMPEVQFLMALAQGADLEGDVEPHLDPDLSIRHVVGETYDAMNACDALIIASGTATLEAGLLQVPMAIIYRVSPLTYTILKRLILIRDIGLANIVAEQRVVQEFVQHEATAERIGSEIVRLLRDEVYRQQVREALGTLRQKLGPSGGSENVARLALELMEDGKVRSEG